MDIKEWVGERRRKIILIAFAILIATLSFGLGYLTNREFSRAPIVIEKHFDK